MLKPLLKKAIPLLAMIPLLGSCSLFQPQTKVIEYDEEVKLHDGSMIWVHITRHYKLVGGAIGDPGWRESTYMPSAVEISWDTGFPNVGRKSVFFDDYVGIIDKYNGNWFIAGEKNASGNRKIQGSTNCNNVGIFITSRCVVAINQQGEYFKPNKNDIYNIINQNIIYPMQIKDWGDIPDPLHNTKLSWNEKLNLDKSQSKRFNGLQTPFITGENK